MKVPILSGIFTDEASDFRTSYPRNMVPVAKKTGVSNGYLRPPEGVIEIGQGPGIDRGGINWDEVCYRVMDTKLVRIEEDGSNTIIGDVGGTGQVTMDYSFDYLAVASSNNLFLYDKVTLQQVTDPDLGSVVDVVWVDGYFMTTDGEFLVVTDLDNPFNVNPLKYGSSEANPDPVISLLKIRNEVYAVNRYTIEVFDNIGGNGFPFARIEGAQIEKGAVGTHAACIFAETCAFVGSGFNEAPSVYMAINSNIAKISTREIDQILSEYTVEEKSKIVCEVKKDNDQDQLWIRLPDRTLVYDRLTSVQVGQPVWFTLTTSLIGNERLKIQNLVWCYGKWIVGDPTSTRIGQLINTTSTHYGEEIGWDFSTLIVYNEGRGAIFNELELISLTGRVPVGVKSTIWTQYSTDGVTFSQEKPRTGGQTGERNKRISWLRQGSMRKTRIQQFRGTSNSHISIAALEATIEPLNE